LNSPYGLPCVENCLTCNLRSDDFFCSLPTPTLAAFNQIKQPAVYPEGAVIFVEGQIPRGIFMLCQGRAKLSITSRDGKKFIVRMAKAGEVLGLHATFTGSPYSVTVETMQPCQLNFVGREDFLAFMETHGDAALHAARHISRDYQDVCNVVRSIGLQYSISERLAKFFLEFSAEGQVVNGEVRTKIALTHEDIGQLIGSSREMISRTIGEFRKMGIVELKGSTLIVRNKVALCSLAAA
jgi:CRP/FNR family transcriptional regulator, cyclic AMP receptor protein